MKLNYFVLYKMIYEIALRKLENIKEFSVTFSIYFSNYYII